MKREGELKSATMKELIHQCPTFVIMLLASAGGPDRVIAGNGKVTTWEFKHATPDFISPGNQALICTRLALQAHCRYVLWQERKGLERTLIVHPRQVLERDGWNVQPEAFCVGFDIQWLVNYVKRIHEYNSK